MDLFKELQTSIDNAQPIGEDVTASPQKKQVGDIDFLKKLSNYNVPFKDGISNRSASNLVQQAHDDAEEVNTVAFGLELNDGEVVKVYVNAEQADDFEKAMADMLGQEDDVEDAIDKMGQTFDIVSVEWPENRKAAAMNAAALDNQTGDQEDNETPASVVAPEVDSEGGSAQPFHKIKVNFDLGELADKPADDTKTTDDKKDADKKDSDEIELDDEEDDDGANFDVEDDIDTEEDDAEDDAEELDKDGKPKKKKKKKEEPVKEALSIGARVRARFLNEVTVKPKDTIKSTAKKKETSVKDNEDDSDEEYAVKLEDIFKTPMQRKLFRLITLFDFPSQRLITHRQDLRANLRSAAIELMSNNKAKIFLDKLIAELEDVRDMDLIHNTEKTIVSQHKKSDLKEQDETQAELIDDLLKVIFKILKRIGVPAQALTVRRTQLQQQMRPLSKELMKHAKVQTYLRSFAKAIGVDEEKDIEEVSEDVNLGSNKYLQLVSTLLSELGVPDDNLNFQRANLIQSLRTKSVNLDLGRVRPRLTALILTLQQTNTVTEAAKIFAKQSAAKLGNWSIAQLNKSITLTVEDISIELNESQTKKLVNAISTGEPVSVKGFKFVPISTGDEYIVYSDSMADYEDGVLFTAKSIRNLTKLFNV